MEEKEIKTLLINDEIESYFKNREEQKESFYFLIGIDEGIILNMIQQPETKSKFEEFGDFLRILLPIPLKIVGISICKSSQKALSRLQVSTKI